MTRNHLETDARARALLRKLRDLNFRSSRVPVGTGAHVRVMGCLSTDTPIERGVRYAVEGPDGDERVLHLAQEGPAVVVRLGERRFAVELDAELDSDTVQAEPLERFLERIVSRAWHA